MWYFFGLGGPCWNDCTACRVSAGQLDIILATIETYPKIAAEMTNLKTRSIRAQDQSVQRSPLAGIKEIDGGGRSLPAFCPAACAIRPNCVARVFHHRL